MDMRQTLDRFSTWNRIGDIADDVLIACAHSSTSLNPEDLRSVEQARQIVEQMTTDSDPRNLTPSTLQSMAPISVPQQIRSTLMDEEATLDGVPAEDSNDEVWFSHFLKLVLKDLDALATGKKPRRRTYDRVEYLFETLARESLRLSRSLLEPQDSPREMRRWMISV